jgi:hypothetical protein
VSVATKIRYGTVKKQARAMGYEPRRMDAAKNRNGYRVIAPSALSLDGCAFFKNGRVPDFEVYLQFRNLGPMRLPSFPEPPGHSLALIGPSQYRLLRSRVLQRPTSALHAPFGKGRFLRQQRLAILLGSAKLVTRQPRDPSIRSG